MISADAKFCNNCGASQGNTVTTAPMPRAATNTVTTVTGKKNGTVMIVIIAAIVVIGIIALFSGSSGVTGKYYFQSMSYEGDTYTVDDLEVQGYDASHFYIELHDDGTAYLYVLGDKTYLEYNDNYMWENGNESDTVPYTVSNGTLKMTQDGATMTFKKK